MLPIQEKYIKYNLTRGRKTVEYIVIHDTGNFASGADAIAHYNYFNGGNRSASADYFVDENNIIKLIPDDCYSWAVGDGKGKYGITNSNSVSIEMCFPAGCNKEKVIKNTLELVIFLMNKYNTPFEKIVRHYDASRKNCPQTLHTDANWNGWIEFKNNLSNLLNGGQSTMGEKELTVEEAKKIIQDKLGFTEPTMQYLWSYRFGDELLIRIAKGL